LIISVNIRSGYRQEKLLEARKQARYVVEFVLTGRLPEGKSVLPPRLKASPTIFASVLDLILL
jgi:hypothetical protein